MEKIHYEFRVVFEVEPFSDRYSCRVFIEKEGLNWNPRLAKHEPESFEWLEPFSTEDRKYTTWVTASHRICPDELIEIIKTRLEDHLVQVLTGLRKLEAGEIAPFLGRWGQFTDVEIATHNKKVSKAVDLRGGRHDLPEGKLEEVFREYSQLWPVAKKAKKFLKSLESKVRNRDDRERRLRTEYPQFGSVDFLSLSQEPSTEIALQQANMNCGLQFDTITYDSIRRRKKPAPK